jgi:hypothetical protein
LPRRSSACGVGQHCDLACAALQPPQLGRNSEKSVLVTLQHTCTRSLTFEGYPGASWESHLGSGCRASRPQLQRLCQYPHTHVSRSLLRVHYISFTCIVGLFKDLCQYLHTHGSPGGCRTPLSTSADSPPIPHAACCPHPSRHRRSRRSSLGRNSEESVP